jgi:hypothetical protein
VWEHVWRVQQKVVATPGYKHSQVLPIALLPAASEASVPMPVDLNLVLLTALLNPVVVVVAFWMGRSADEWQKVPVAAFAASAAGTAAVYVAARLGVPGVAGTIRAIAGILIVQFVLGLAWAAAGYLFARRAP